MTIGAQDSLPVHTVVRERYRILAIVGRGGVGTVYKVADTLLGTTYALKELADQSSGARKQFENEAQWLRALNHPSIPKVREYFDWEGRLYLVMDFVEGENLEQKLARGGGRPLPVCDALDYLHSQMPPILHRDVKPANIIVTPAGHPVLVDLGIAKEHLPGAGMTATFVRKAGTEGYAPPEQYTAAGKTGPWSDVYGLGATLYELLTGTIPPTAVERVALDSPMMRPRALNPSISPYIDEVVTRSLALRPADRFQAMRVVSQALRGGSGPLAPSIPSSPMLGGGIPSTPGFGVRMPSGPGPAARMPSGPSAPQPAPIWRTNPSPPPPSGASGGLGALPQLDVPGSSPIHSYAAPNAAPPALGGLLPGLPRTGGPAPSAQAWPGAAGSYDRMAAPAGAAGGAANSRSRRAVSSLLTEETPAASARDPGRRRGPRLLVAASIALILVLAAGAVAIFVFGVFRPPDRSSPQVTASGYYAALQGEDFTLAWQYSAASHNNPTSLPGFIGSLRADDDRFGKVLSYSITGFAQDSGGRARVTVEVRRASAPDTPITYALVMTQYDGSTWLIESISGA